MLPRPHEPSRGPQYPPTSQRRNSPAATDSSSHSSSPTLSDSSEDEFLYVLGHVNTTKEAIERIRAVQLPREKKKGGLLDGLGGSSTTPARPMTTAPNTDDTFPQIGGELPATMGEFREYPHYIVSLTAAREAIFSDALSGFHSHVAREEAERDQLSPLHIQQDLCHHEHKNPSDPKKPTHYVGTYDTQGGIVRTLAIPSPSPTRAPERNAVLATASASLAKPAAIALKPKGVIVEEEYPASAATSDLPVPARQCAESAGSVSPHIPTAHISPVHSHAPGVRLLASSSSSAPAVTPNGVTVDSFQSLPSMESETSGGEAAASRTAVYSTTHTPPVDRTAHASTASENTTPTLAPPLSTQQAEQAANLKEMHRQAFLRERVCQRRRVPVVFRYRYSPDFEETIEENKLRNHLLDRALRNHERIIGPRGLTKEERQEISKRFADPIALDPEWPYVWEQFERDIPRETLFVEDTPYHDAHDALAAILSYVEYSYDRGQQHIAEKSAAALAAAKNSGGAFTTAAGAPKEKTFLRHFISAGTAALKDAVVTMRSNLPDFLGDRLLTVSGYDPALYHASLVFPTDPQARSEKIFEAVREVVLASQQSFMGFPYQLLCEQVGTERLCLALDALERDQAEDHDHLDEGAEAETTARVSSGHAMRNEKRVTTSSSSEASASIPIKETENQEDLVTQNSLLEQTSLHSSRVAHIHEYPHLTTTKDRSGNVHHDCCHTIDAVDEKLVASPMPEQEVGEQPVVGLGAILAHCLSETERRRREIVARRSRERRRRRQERMPLLVGEPRPHEFDAFVNIVRDQCIAKEVREERKKKATQRCEQVQQIPKRQCEHQRSVPTSPQELHLGSPPFSFAPLDLVKKTNEAPLAATEQAAGTANSPRKLFREDIEGSTYLIPARSATAAMEAALLYSSRPPLSQTLAREVATSPETRGMRICLFFDEKRNVPVVVVNKLFRLFTVPGLSGPISSEDDTPEALNGEATAKTGAANPNPPAPQSGAGRTGSLKKSLLLLIQVHFALFLKEEVEIRWKWWKL